MVTASTYRKLHHFCDRTRLDVLHRGLLKVADRYGWRMEAWAVFPNHYHFVAHSPDDREAGDGAESLRRMLRFLHSETAKWVNALDDSRDRRVWNNYWESRITFQTSLLARLNYVHRNAVHHGLVGVASAYPWCSAGWFERVATPAQVRTVYRFKTERLTVYDDFEVKEAGDKRVENAG